MICSNCGRETTGDLCQWCGYPIVRGSLVKRQRLRRETEGAKEADERTEREVEEVKEAKEKTEKAAKEAKQAKGAKEKTKKEAKEAKQAKGAKEKTKKETKEAKEKAKREAEKAKQAKRAKEASEKAKREEAKAKEAKRAKEAKEKAKKAAKEDKEKAKKKEVEEEELEPAAVAKLYEGVVELTIVPPIDLAQTENLAKGLRQVENLRLILVGGSVDRGSKIIVSAEEPVPLLSILREMPVVEQVFRKGAEIQVRLKAE